ncbi:beta-1 2-xylosyltransferase 1 [Fusarium subglutinans]|uniref:Beta-1 2-xylosyltransferase 1 n=1 Tax=Gibberella subglutinans TaxID=42677 RepID=A0A8H5PED4_GIBSU|nr:beta-1 2-xylosyltransferase 1 [Fusarium subglutinans]KAF5595270.1 beta-1 2-xylosyltransferase 1 [Fusarium subglutinans]
MIIPRDFDSNPQTSIALSLLLTVATSYLFHREDELLSEIICWACLPMIFGANTLIAHARVDSPTRPETRHTLPSVLPLWAVAGCLSIVSGCRAEADSYKLLPVLTPLLLWTERGLSRSARGRETTDNSKLAPLCSKLWLAALVAALLALVLIDWNYSGLAPSGVATGASFIAYVSFQSRPRGGRSLPDLNPFEEHVYSLAPRVTGLLLVGSIARVSIFGLPRISPLNALFLGLVKALSWRCVASAARHTSWALPTMMATFGLLATRDPFEFTFESQALFNAISALLCLGQIAGFVPRQIRPTRFLCSCITLPIIPYVANIMAICHVRTDARTFTAETPHPVMALYNKALNEFENQSRRQSRTFEAASHSYQTKYGIEPPQGFKEWYDAARSNDSPLVDAFDSLYQTISPFWRVSGSQVLDAMHQAKTLPGSDLWLCTFSGTSSTAKCSHSHRTFDRHITRMFNNILANFTGLPDVTFLVNHIDEPRVIYQPSPEASAPHDLRITVGDRSRQPIWDSLTKSCGPEREVEVQDNINTLGIPFVTNTSLTQDLCQHPEYSASHGFMISPVSFRPIHGLVPIFSTGKLSTMSDILIPSPAYIEQEFIYDESRDVDWGRKRNNLYWAGSTTGGFALDTHWQLFHRQRFVELTQNLRATKCYHYLRMKDGVAQKVKSSFLNGRLFDVTFTRIFQCQRQACRDQDAYFNTKSWVDKDEALKSKLAFDIDGNGISGRYYKLLASKSAPTKQTLFQEWHDDRLIPWLHYIPVSQSMEELPELVFYLTSTASGKEIARQIAERGRQWHARAFREVDMGLYVYRLLLEMARLQDPQRNTSWE